MTAGLNSSQKSYLESTLFLGESELLEIEEYLTNDKSREFLHIEDNFTPLQKEDLLKKIIESRKDIIDLKHRFNLEPKKLPLRNMINAKLSGIWVNLEDAKAKNLRHYGKLENSTRN